MGCPGCGMATPAHYLNCPHSPVVLDRRDTAALLVAPRTERRRMFGFVCWPVRWHGGPINPTKDGA